MNHINATFWSNLLCAASTGLLGTRGSPFFGHSMGWKAKLGRSHVMPPRAFLRPWCHLLSSHFHRSQSHADHDGIRLLNAKTQDDNSEVPGVPVSAFPRIHGVIDFSHHQRQGRGEGKPSHFKDAKMCHLSGHRGRTEFYLSTNISFPMAKSDKRNYCRWLCYSISSLLCDFCFQYNELLPWPG